MALNQDRYSDPAASSFSIIRGLPCQMSKATIVSSGITLTLDLTINALPYSAESSVPPWVILRLA
jgi:hypothetical protein